MYRCPRCERCDLVVDAVVDGAIDENGHLEILGSNARFDLTSPVFCAQCGFVGKAKDFQFDPADIPKPCEVAEPDWAEVQRRLGFGPDDNPPSLDQVNTEE